MRPWIGVDFDGTLCVYDGWDAGRLGDPVPAMVERVKKWLQSGMDVKIVTARANPEGRPHRDVVWQIKAIEEWCEKYIGVKLPVTCSKDFAMVTLYDDRCITVEQNTGRLLSTKTKDCRSGE